MTAYNQTVADPTDLRDAVTAAVRAAPLIAAGYRRISHKNAIVSRIDREDWLMVLAEHLHRAPADFYVPGQGHPAGNWCDFYRRVLSKDTLATDHEVSKVVPSSNGDATGFVPPHKS